MEAYKNGTVGLGGDRISTLSLNQLTSAFHSQAVASCSNKLTLVAEQLAQNGILFKTQNKTFSMLFERVMILKEADTDGGELLLGGNITPVRKVKLTDTSGNILTHTDTYETNSSTSYYIKRGNTRYYYYYVLITVELQAIPPQNLVIFTEAQDSDGNALTLHSWENVENSDSTDGEGETLRIITGNETLLNSVMPISIYNQQPIKNVTTDAFTAIQGVYTNILIMIDSGKAFAEEINITNLVRQTGDTTFMLELITTTNGNTIGAVGVDYTLVGNIDLGNGTYLQQYYIKYNNSLENVITNSVINLPSGYTRYLGLITAPNTPKQYNPSITPLTGLARIATSLDTGLSDYEPLSNTLLDFLHYFGTSGRYNNKISTLISYGFPSFSTDGYDNLRLDYFNIIQPLTMIQVINSIDHDNGYDSRYLLNRIGWDITS